MKLKNLFIIFIIFTAIYSIQNTRYSNVRAQTPTPQVLISYPVTIPDVGTCNSWADCHKLCADPVNQSACYAWAVGSKLIKPVATDQLNKAMQELKCTSKESCALYCADPANADTCRTVGKKYNLLPDFSQRTQDLINKATDTQTKTEISKLAAENNIKPEEVSTNLDSLCSKKENAERCKRIASGIGVHTSSTPGPGGCTTPDTCRKYCDNPDNFSECQSFGMTGPHGCTTQLSCYQACQTTTGCTNTKITSPVSIDPAKPETVQVLTKLSTSCSDVLSKISGGTVLDAVAKLKNTGVCELYDVNDTSKDALLKSCASYLDENSQKPFNGQDFSRYCSALAKIPEQKANQTTIQKTKTPADTTTLDTTCTLLQNLGTSNSSYTILAQKCKSSTVTIKKALTDCSRPTSQRTIVTNDQEQRAYCLTAPVDITAYQTACSQNPTACKSYGYDWYCKQNPSSCVPLIEGKSISTVSKQFSSGINIVTAINAYNAAQTNQSAVPSGSPLRKSSGSNGRPPFPANTFFQELHSSSPANWDIPTARISNTPGQKPPTIPYTGWTTIVPLVLPGGTQQLLNSPSIYPLITQAAEIINTKIEDISNTETGSTVVTPTYYPTPTYTTTYYSGSSGSGSSGSGSSGSSGSYNLTPTPTKSTSSTEPTKTPTPTLRPTYTPYPTYIQPSPTPVPTLSSTTNYNTTAGSSANYVTPTPLSTVKGVSDTKSWWQIILEFINGK